MANILNFGERLRSARRLSGYSQKEFANKLEVSQSTVSQWECNINLPTIGYFALMIQVLEVSPEYLLGLSDDL